MKEDLWKAMAHWMRDSTQNKFPSSQIPTVHRIKSEFDTPSETGFRVTWISHSSILIEIDGKRFLTDPVWGIQSSLDRRSHWPGTSCAGSTRFAAKLVLPVHWATFSLALHSWTEPGERILVSANKSNVKVALPKPGESFEPTSKNGYPNQKWWPDVAWEPAEQSPIVSSGL